jgi:hypothetical protein
MGTKVGQIVHPGGHSVKLKQNREMVLKSDSRETTPKEVTSE